MLKFIDTKLVTAAAAALVKGAVCSARSWPNYDQTCQFDLRTSADHVRPVRVLDLERARNPLNVVIASR